jgi:hypothetical protein
VKRKDDRKEERGNGRQKEGKQMRKNTKKKI